MSKNKTVELDLVGLDGNAFALMGAFQHAARQQGWTHKEIYTVLAECQRGDYDHMLQTLMKYTYSGEEPCDEE